MTHTCGMAASLRGLNRTSVGLKPLERIANALDLNVPQSNQRGIETSHSPPDRLNLRIGLNRTSVGLKRISCRLLDRPGWQPQSNQRGIETGKRDAFGERGAGLNRTSVGLKRVSFASV